MLDAGSLTLFLIATLALLIVPGPAVLYVVARSIEQGRRAGLVSTLGIGVGTLFHVGAAALGVSAVLLSSAPAFRILQYAGAAYLLFLGIRKLMGRESIDADEELRDESLWKVFRQGVVVNILNPKTALFFFAFLPQFVDPAAGAVMLQTLILGMLFVALAVLSDGAYALVAGSAGNWLRRNRRFLAGQRIFAGVTYCALGLLAAFTGSAKK